MILSTVWYGLRWDICPYCKNYYYSYSYCQTQDACRCHIVSLRGDVK
jgi:hypothetical protein